MIHPRVLCFGEVLFDRIADQAGVPLQKVQSWTDYPGGAPANVACALTKLGTSSGFIGCVGSDPEGDTLVKLLQEVGVDTTGIQRHPTAPTRSVYVTRSQNGDRQFSGFGTRNTTEFADAQFEAEQLPIDLFVSADFLVIGTLEFAYPRTRQAMKRALELAENYFLKVIMDINWRPMFWPDPTAAVAAIQELLPQIDFLKLSREEADWVFKTTDPGAIAYRLGSVEGVLVTAGEKGCAYYLSENEGKVPGFAVNAEDTTGAGDAFLAGFLHQLCQHKISDFKNPRLAEDVVSYASAVGALTTLRPGAIASQPTAAEVAAFLHKHQQED